MRCLQRPGNPWVVERRTSMYIKQTPACMILCMGIFICTQYASAQEVVGIYEAKNCSVRSAPGRIRHELRCAAAAGDYAKMMRIFYLEDGQLLLTVEYNFVVPHITRNRIPVVVTLNKKEIKTTGTVERGSRYGNPQILVADVDRILPELKTTNTMTMRIGDFRNNLTVSMVFEGMPWAIVEFARRLKKDLDEEQVVGD